MQLTETETRVLNFFFVSSIPPTLGELSDAMGWRSASYAARICNAMHERGLLRVVKWGTQRKYVLAVDLHAEVVDAARNHYLHGEQLGLDAAMDRLLAAEAGKMQVLVHELAPASG